jgi:hypothetical protein
MPKSFSKILIYFLKQHTFWKALLAGACSSSGAVSTCVPISQKSGDSSYKYWKIEKKKKNTNIQGKSGGRQDPK